jgi:hypothetical protein
MKANEFLGLLFLARDVAHSVHLNTRSFSKHEALNIFYNRIIGAADDFAEAYQGRYGLIGPITLNSAKKTANVIEFLQDSLAEIESLENEESWSSRVIDEQSSKESRTVIVTQLSLQDDSTKG